MSANFGPDMAIEVAKMLRDEGLAIDFADDPEWPDRFAVLDSGGRPRWTVTVAEYGMEHRRYFPYAKDDPIRQHDADGTVVWEGYEPSQTEQNEAELTKALGAMIQQAGEAEGKVEALQARLRDAEAALRVSEEQREELRQVLGELLNYARGNPVVLDKIHRALTTTPPDTPEKEPSPEFVQRMSDWRDKGGFAFGPPPLPPCPYCHSYEHNCPQHGCRAPEKEEGA